MNQQSPKQRPTMVFLAFVFVFISSSAGAVDIPRPPVADANGPYVLNLADPLSTLTLDGSGSFDIDPGDSIIAYGWELDFISPYDFDEATGIAVDATAFFSAKGIGIYNVGLRVTDNSANVFGSPNLTDEDYTTVQVINVPEPALATLLVIGAAGFGYQRRRQIKAA